MCMLWAGTAISYIGHGIRSSLKNLICECFICEMSWICRWLKLGKETRWNTSLTKKLDLLRWLWLPSSLLTLMFLFLFCIAEHDSICRLTVYFTHQLCILTTMGLSPALFVRMATLSMSWLLCRYLYLSYIVHFPLQIN